MKSFLIQATTRDGEYEYGEQLVVKGLDLDHATDRAKAELLKLYSNDDETRFNDRNQINLWERIIELDRVSEIPDADYEVLKKYLWEIV